VKEPVLLDPEVPPELNDPVPVQPVVSYWTPVPPETGLETVEFTLDPALYHPCPVAESCASVTVK